jgi:DNA ligase D-like protein (predicted ligase)
MLARVGRPFDAEDHLFEVKWDGFRALAFVADGRYRLLSRRRTDFTQSYPELGFLADLAPGTVLDGELVLLVDGKPDFESMLRRQQVRGDLAVQRAAASDPVTYIVFDLLYEDGTPIVDRPLVERRERLRALVERVGHPRIVLSEGVVGGGKAFFEQVRRLGLEGMVAKDLNSRYEPGQRSGAWTKVKDPKLILCAVLGWLADDRGDVQSLVIATNESEGLRPVGKVGAGLTEAMRDRLRGLLSERETDGPLVPCAERGARWVEPGIYCKVRFLERTGSGTLRAPVFHELVVDDS